MQVARVPATIQVQPYDAFGGGSSQAPQTCVCSRGAASALYGSIQMLIGFLGSALVGGIHGSGELILSVGYVVFGVFAFFVYWSTLYGNLEKTSNLQERSSII